MDRSNPFDAFLPSIGDPPTGRQSNGHIDGSINSRDSNISEVYNDHAQPPLSQARTFYSDPHSRWSSDLNTSRITPRDTDPYLYKSSRSRSISHPSSSSNLLVLPFAQPSEDQTSEPLIHMSSLQSNHRNALFPSAMVQHHSSNADSLLTREQKYLRCQTQWHPLCNQQQETPNQNFGATVNQHSQQNMDTQHGRPVAGRRSPSSTLTSDPIISLIKSINKSTSKLHSSIIKQQEALVNQQNVFTKYLHNESSLRKEQNALLQKQLNAIIALAPAKARVSSDHFQPSSVDSILFASSTNQPEHPSTLQLDAHDLTTSATVNLIMV